MEKSSYKALDFFYLEKTQRKLTEINGVSAQNVQYKMRNETVVVVRSKVSQCFCGLESLRHRPRKKTSEKHS